MTPLTSRKAISANNARAESQFIAKQEKHSKKARADEKRVAALRRAFAARVEAQTRGGRCGRGGSRGDAARIAAGAGAFAAASAEASALAKNE